MPMETAAAQAVSSAEAGPSEAPAEASEEPEAVVTCLTLDLLAEDPTLRTSYPPRSQPTAYDSHAPQPTVSPSRYHP